MKNEKCKDIDVKKIHVQWNHWTMKNWKNQHLKNDWKSTSVQMNHWRRKKSTSEFVKSVHLLTLLLGLWVQTYPLQMFRCVFFTKQFNPWKSHCFILLHCHVQIVGTGTTDVCSIMTSFVGTLNAGTFKLGADDGTLEEKEGSVFCTVVRLWGFKLTVFEKERESRLNIPPLLHKPHLMWNRELWTSRMCGFSNRWCCSK